MIKYNKCVSLSFFESVFDFYYNVCHLKLHIYLGTKAFSLSFLTYINFDPNFRLIQSERFIRQKRWGDIFLAFSLFCSLVSFNHLKLKPYSSHSSKMCRVSEPISTTVRVLMALIGTLHRSTYVFLKVLRLEKICNW